MSGLGILVLLTLISNMVNWTMGSNRAAAEAGELPAYVARRHAKYGSPVGANTVTGVVATLVILAYALLAQSNDELSGVSLPSPAPFS